ncbi:MAG: IreB family regulatory phosphoprotein [Blautia sp.]|nr:IreB family regulatory phosphoprotein [Blautia sp.]
MSDANLGSTQYFRVVQEQPMEVKEIIKGVFAAMQEKGYNPINQFVGYIMSGDPTYITSHKGARGMIMRVERDELVEELLTEYVKNRSWEEPS